MIKDVGGLDVELMVPNFYGGDQESQLYNLSTKTRTIIFQMGLNPSFETHESYSDLRDDVYRAIAMSRTGMIQVQFKFNDFVVAAVSGTATKVEADLFEKALEIQFHLECKDPMLKGLEPVYFDLDNLDPANTAMQDNNSSAPHGFSFVLDFNATVAELTISNETHGFEFRIVPKTPFINNDQLYFSSDFRNKYLYRKRGSAILHLADKIAFNSIWPVIFPGLTEIQVSSGASVFWSELSHYETYWGV